MRIFEHYDLVAGYGSSFPRDSILGRLEQVSIEHAMQPTPRWYGVSTGDGNMGVSRMHPNYYVFTSDPWLLAERAAKSDIKPEFHDEIEIDGEADFGVSASLYDPDLEYCSYIVEVFPADWEEIERERNDSYGRFCYGSIVEALGE